MSIFKITFVVKPDSGDEWSTERYAVAERPNDAAEMAQRFIDNMDVRTRRLYRIDNIQYLGEALNESRNDY